VSGIISADVKIVLCYPKIIETRLVYFLQEKKNHLIIKTLFMEMIVATNAHLLMTLLKVCPEQAP